MIVLNDQQSSVVDYPNNILVTACPGSGKTHVLTQRVAKAIEELQSPKRRVVAMTYTNRATDEITARLDLLGIDQAQLWAGTIHSFAAEWLLRPYAPYVPRLKRGFAIVDEFASERLLDQLRAKHGVPRTGAIITRRSRGGNRPTSSMEVSDVLSEYDAYLEAQHLLDYDDVLYLAYWLLANNQEIAATVAGVIAWFCVDEIQDTHDLQYGILAAIVTSGNGRTKIFCVGDSDQAIYESLGAVVKTPTQLATEFGLAGIEHRSLSGNYRSTQRIVDLYQTFRPHREKIIARSTYATEAGKVTFRDQTCTKDDVPTVVAACIQESLTAGVAQGEICVVAPQWWHVRSIGRALVTLLPDVDFDAPGLSPLHAQRDSIWFKVARLFLTTPSPRLYGTRMRWAWEVLRDLEEIHQVSVPQELDTARRLLRFANSIQPVEEDGLKYLRDVFAVLVAECRLELGAHRSLQDAHDLFFAKAERRLADSGEGVTLNVSDLRKLFKHPAGVVVDTCHGIKGEEYDTVIAFGLLRGYIPNWRDIFDEDGRFASDRESKLLYVICSRAKRRLHLIAESGRRTGKGWPLETAPLLAGSQFGFDDA